MASSESRTHLVTITATIKDGSFSAGSKVDLIARFSKPVIVDTTRGVPTISLNTFPVEQVASYISGSGTTDLLFRYIVQEGDTAQDLDYKSIDAFSMNGAVVKDLDASEVVLMPPAPGGPGSLSAIKNIEIDTTAPTLEFSSVAGANPGSALNPRILGTASEPSSVTLYFDSACATAKSTETGNTVFATPGIAITADVNSNTTTDIFGKAVDSAGNQSACTPLGTYTHDGVAPTVTGITSSTNNGTYKAGATISIQVSFSESVIVSGTPTLALNSGGTATYVSGSNSTTLTFSYTIASAENTSDLDYAATGSLTAGTHIRDLPGNDAALTLVAPGDPGSLAHAKNIAVDTTSPTLAFTSVSSTNPDNILRPTILGTTSEPATVTLFFASDCAAPKSTETLNTIFASPGITVTADVNTNTTTEIFGKAVDSVGNTSACTPLVTYTHDGVAPTVTGVTSSTENGIYKEGSAVSIQVSFSETVIVSGTPTLTLNSGGTASYVSGSNSTTLTFSYTIASTENSSDLDYSATGSLTAGTYIRDLPGNDATLTLVAPGDPGSLAQSKNIVVDTTSPTLAFSAVSGPNPGSTLRPTILGTASEPSSVTLYFDSACATAKSTETGNTVFATPGIAITADVNSNTTTDIFGKAVDSAGNTSACTPLGTYTHDGVAPTVTGITSSTNNGTYKAGATISIQVSFSESVIVSGTPTLALNSGGTATYVSGSNSTTLNFSYTIASTGNTSDLDYATTGSLTAGTHIRDLPGNDATLTLVAPGDPGSLAHTKNIAVDTTSPTPGNSGSLGAASGQSVSGFVLNWPAASDNQTTSASLEYMVCAIPHPSTINTIEDCEANTVMAWSVNTTTFTATNMNYNTTYNYNVLVRDQVGNKTLYTSSSTATLAYESAASATSQSPQRKTFYDAASGKHWAFWHEGSNVRYGYSTNGANFTRSATTLAIPAPRFAISAKAGYVLIAYESNYDIVVRRGSISGSSISWDSAVTALDGNSATNTFTFPAMTIASDDRVYVGAIRHDGAPGNVFTPSVSKSNAQYSAALSWPSASTAGLPVSEYPENFALVAYGSFAMALTTYTGGSTLAYSHNGTSWSRQAGNAKGWIKPLVSTTYPSTITTKGGEIYAGGTTNMLQDIGSTVAKWNGSRWEPIPNSPDGTVAKLKWIGGYLYAGGRFTTVGGTTPANNVARWNGSTWEALSGGVTHSTSSSAYVNAFEELSGEIYVGGTFTSAGGNAASNIAKWHPTNGWQALSTGVSGGSVYALAVFNSELYATGGFTAAGGIAAKGIAKWNGTSWSSIGHLLDGSYDGVGNALIASSSHLIVAGWFSSAGGVSATNIARWSGTTWTAIGTGFTEGQFAVPMSIEISGSDIYVGGYYCTSSTCYGKLSRWDGLSWQSVGGQPNSDIYDLAWNGTELIASGDFDFIGTAATGHLARWNGLFWSPIAGVGNGPFYPDQILAVGNDLYAAGTLCTGTAWPIKVAKWNGSSWTTLGGDFNSTIRALAHNGTDIYAAGSFTSVGGVSIARVARFNGSSWVGLSTGLNNQVNALLFRGGILYAGGWFSQAGSVTTKGIAQWNGTSWSDVGGGVTASNGYVSALASTATDLFIGGSFTTAGTTAAKNVAKWTGTAWEPLSDGMNSGVGALTMLNNDLVAGGSFTLAGTTVVKNVAKWNGTSWEALGAGLAGAPLALFAQGADVYAGGYTGLAGSSPANNVAKWNGTTWEPLGKATSSSVGSLGWYDGDLHAAGFGLARYSTISVASNSSMSLASDASGVHMAYIDRSDSKPRYLTFNGGIWGTANLISANASQSGTISIGTATDSSQWLIAWDRNGQIEYRKYSDSAWSPITALGPSSGSRFPSLPEVISETNVPVFWSKWGLSSYELGMAPVAFP